MSVGFSRIRIRRNSGNASNWRIDATSAYPVCQERETHSKSWRMASAAVVGRDAFLRGSNTFTASQESNGKQYHPIYRVLCFTGTEFHWPAVTLTFEISVHPPGLLEMLSHLIPRSASSFVERASHPPHLQKASVFSRHQS